MLLAAVTSGRWRESQWITRDMRLVFPVSGTAPWNCCRRPNAAAILLPPTPGFSGTRIRRCVRRLPGAGATQVWTFLAMSGRCSAWEGGPARPAVPDWVGAAVRGALSGPGTVSVRAEVRSIFPLRCLEVVRNGEVVMRAEAADGLQAEISEELRIDANSWIACRAFGADYHLDEWGRRVFAHTSPVYIACGGDWTMTDPEGILVNNAGISGDGKTTPPPPPATVTRPRPRRARSGWRCCQTTGRPASSSPGTGRRSPGRGGT